MIRHISSWLLLVCAALASTYSAADSVRSFPDDISEMRLPAADPRIPVRLAGEDRAYVLGQMRLFLSNIQRINEALGKGNLDLVAKVAALSGSRRNENDPSRPAGLRDRQPAAYNKYIGALRKEFDELSLAAPRSSAQEISGRVGHLMENCVGCHQIFRLSDN